MRATMQFPLNHITITYKYVHTHKYIYILYINVSTKDFRLPRLQYFFIFVSLLVKFMLNIFFALETFTHILSQSNRHSARLTCSVPSEKTTTIQVQTLAFVYDFYIYVTQMY